MTNDALHKDLQILTVTKLATRHYKKYHSKLHSNQNSLISCMSSNTILNNPLRRLKIKWPKNALPSNISWPMRFARSRHSVVSLSVTLRGRFRMVLCLLVALCISTCRSAGLETKIVLTRTSNSGPSSG